jgi:four helix bundle protein
VVSAGAGEHEARSTLELPVYPKALFLSHLAWEDTDQMMKDPRGRVVAQQLTDSIGSICANIEEGYGRGFGKENAYATTKYHTSAKEVVYCH